MATRRSRQRAVSSSDSTLALKRAISFSSSHRRGPEPSPFPARSAFQASRRSRAVHSSGVEPATTGPPGSQPINCRNAAISDASRSMMRLADGSPSSCSAASTVATSLELPFRRPASGVAMSLTMSKKSTSCQGSVSAPPHRQLVIHAEAPGSGVPARDPSDATVVRHKRPCDCPISTGV